MRHRAPRPLSALSALTLSALSALTLSALTPARAYAHGGVPRVIAVEPAGEDVWVLDTLGFFRAGGARGARAEGHAWLCDDALDPMAGVDVSARLGGGALIAVARSGTYRSDDRGCTFERVGGELSAHAVGLLSPHPARPAEALAATFTLGLLNDVFVTEDEGRTWRGAGLAVEGGIYSIIRHPSTPERVWVTHARGLSVSGDGGRSFRDIAVEVEGLTLRPQELKLLGATLAPEGRVTAGVEGGGVTLWMSVSQYPTSTLLIGVESGNNGGITWRPAHRVADNYASLASSGDRVFVATPFEGLFIAQLTAEPPTPEGAAWEQRADVFVGCLTWREGRLWGCGRGAPTAWLVGYSDDAGGSWRAWWDTYEEAAGATWECPAGAPSVVACAARCLGEGCDPSGLLPAAGAQAGAQAGGVEGAANAGGAGSPAGVTSNDGAGDGEVASPPAQSGCAQGPPAHTVPRSLPLLPPLLLALSAALRAALRAALTGRAHRLARR